MSYITMAWRSKGTLGYFRYSRMLPNLAEHNTFLCMHTVFIDLQDVITSKTFIRQQHSICKQRSIMTIKIRINGKEMEPLLSHRLLNIEKIKIEHGHTLCNELYIFSLWHNAKYTKCSKTCGVDSSYRETKQ